MLPLGTPAPPFDLPDVTTGRHVALADFSEDSALLVIFLCAHCPYVIHVQEELARLGRDYQSSRVGIAAICSNDADAYPDDAPDRLAAMARKLDLTFPILSDASQAVARAYGATCTPDFFLFDAARLLVYRGQLDDSRPGRGIPDGRDLRAALDALLAGRPIDPNQKPSLGCNIKWKPGTSPANR
jgi:peroxiredoxin